MSPARRLSSIADAGAINVAQSLADLYAITRKSIRTDRLPFCLHQHLCFMLFEILGSENRYRLAQGSAMPRQTALPPSLAPRLISREAAAAYICVSPNTFDEMVKNGQMPRARLLGERRRAWDVRQLDIAIDELPSDGNNTRVDETWSDVDAPEAAAFTLSAITSRAIG